MQKVVIVQRRLTHYRVPFFLQLRAALREHEVDLKLLVGEANARERQKRDEGFLDWAQAVPTRYWLGGRLCWQSYQPQLEGAQLVILTQENALLANQLLLAKRNPFKLAFWGHGANFQSAGRKTIREMYKRWTTRRVAWWFAYTASSAAKVLAAGFPSGRITVVNNALDTAEIREHRRRIDDEEVAAFQRQVGSARIGLYVGSLYKEKRLDFLISAAESIRQKIPDFNLLLIGDGELREELSRSLARLPWVRLLGPKFGREKIVALRAANVLLNPGAVGLVMLDSICSELPLVTTDCKIHGPEISYLRQWSNGVMTENRVDAFADAVVHVLNDPDLQARMRYECSVDAKKYTMEQMVERFTLGVLAALNT